MHVCADSFYAFSARLLYMKFTNKVTEYDIPFSEDGYRNGLANSLS